jgi:hypothetical protein
MRNLPALTAVQRRTDKWVIFGDVYTCIRTRSQMAPMSLAIKTHQMSKGIALTLNVKGLGIIGDGFSLLTN